MTALIIGPLRDLTQPHARTDFLAHVSGSSPDLRNIRRARPFQRFFRRLHKRPGLEVPAAKRQFGCLDVDQPNLSPVVQNKHVAIDNGNSDRPFGPLEA